MTKHNNRKVRYFGIEFDSQLEGERYLYLRSLQDAGEISGLETHPRFVLQEALDDNFGHHHRPITYSADFQYYNAAGDLIAEDTKGYATEVFKIKRKLLAAAYPELDFRIVKKARGGWSVV